jgi:regulator of protease activity HflC (stomatin/prohibitin superfamily)
MATAFNNNMSDSQRNLARTVIIAVVVLIVAWILSPFIVVSTGTRGVVTNFGNVQDKVLAEGIHFRIPIYESIVPVDVRVQKEQTEADASSKDLQDVNTTVAINYQVVPEFANWVYQNLGQGYKERIIDPQVQESVKAVTAKYNATELISARDKVRTEIKESLEKTLSKYHLRVIDFAIVNFKFSRQFTQAIEDKQTAEQRALKATRDLERIKVEAEQKVASAKAEAESLSLQRQAVSAELIELRRIEAQREAIAKWNGVLPNVTGGAMPFIDVTKTK